MTTQKDQLRLTDKLFGKGLVLELWTDTPHQIEAFKELCYTLLGRDTQWFHQCNTETYQMFEFWCGLAKLDLVIERCQLVAKRNGRELMIDLSETQAA